MDSEQFQDSEDRDIEQILRAVGRREQPPGDMKPGWEQAFRAELGLVRARQRRRRLMFACSIAASIALAAVLLSQVLVPTPPTTLEARLSYLSGDVTLNDAPVSPGQTLLPGDLLSVAEGAAAVLRVPGYEVRVREGSTLSLGEEALQLTQGAVYADSAEASPVAQRLRISTDYGSVSPVGTQFTLEILRDASIVVVRQGEVDVEHQGLTTRLAHSPGVASRARLSMDPSINISEVPARGDAWAWIHRSAQPFMLEGSSAYEFLAWAAKENGLALVFIGASAEIYAKTTTLHGDMGDLPLLRALEPVLASTNLVASSSGNALEVSLQRPN
jgi:FecR protein